MQDTGNLKDAAMHFLKLAASGNVDEAYARYVDPGFIHHNPHFMGDRASLMAAMKENAAAEPNKAFTVKATIQEGDKVAVHSHVRTESMDLAVVHIVRFSKGKIVELWDLAQPMPKDSPNQYGMF
jgi:predicted SnoaL-like aldol condensation-catalyzing enzyme